MIQHMLHIGTEIISSDIQNKTLKKKITCRGTYDLKDEFQL